MFLGWLCISLGAACALAAALAHKSSTPHAPSHGHSASIPKAVPGALPATSIIVPNAERGVTEAPSADEMAMIRARMAAEIEALVPPGGQRIPTTSGVAYTLGTRGASLAVVWPTSEGLALSCADSPLSGEPSREAKQ